MKPNFAKSVGSPGKRKSRSLPGVPLGYKIVRLRKIEKTTDLSNFIKVLGITGKTKGANYFYGIT